jgi:hypothetical protein
MGRRFLGRWKEQIGRHAEPGTEPLHHRHAQPLLPAEYFAYPTWGAKDRHHVDSR